jgi:hypothetical protein
MLLEVRVPISPTPAFLNRIRLIAASLREWYPNVQMNISCFPPIIGEPDVYWRTPGEDEFNFWAGTRSPYLATVLDTWKPPFHGDYILHLDGDVIPIRPFPEFFAEKGLCGVQAHVSPCTKPDWCQLFQRFGLAAPDMRHVYSGHGIMTAHEMGPLYYNSGVVFGRRELFERLSGEYLDAIDFLRRNLPDTYWFDQIGLAAAALPARTFPLRWNFPNRPAFDRAHPDELADVRFLHAMQTDIVDRDRDFESDQAMHDLCCRSDLDGSNEILRRRVTDLRT